MTEKRRFVLITTDSNKRGVFAGWLEEKYIEGDSIGVILSEARNCIYWSQTTRGVFGLAAKGPDENCRIGPAVPRLELIGITSVSDCSQEAQKAWGKEPWKE